MMWQLISLKYSRINWQQEYIFNVKRKNSLGNIDLIDSLLKFSVLIFIPNKTLDINAKVIKRTEEIYNSIF